MPITTVISSDKEFVQPRGVDFDFLWQVWDVVLKRHYNRNNLDLNKMVWGATKGMLESLDSGRSTLISYDDFGKVLDYVNKPGLRSEIFVRSYGGRSAIIGYIAISSFYENLKDDILKVARDFRTKNISKIILDLRHNTGGNTNSAQDLCGEFLGADKVIAIRDFGDGRTEMLKSTSGSSFLGMETVCLIDRYTASASEIVVGALKDHLGTKLVGQTTHGKGSIQSFIRTRNHGIIRITIAHWTTPNGTVVDGRGLKPDYQIKSATSLATNHTDPFIDKAIELLLAD